MDRRATLCPDSLLPRAPSIFPGQRSLTALMIVAHLKIDAEHNWSVTRSSFSDWKALGLAASLSKIQTCCGSQPRSSGSMKLRPGFKNSQKRGLPTRKAVNRLTPLLDPASEKAQAESVVLGNINFDLWRSEYG